MKKKKQRFDSSRKRIYIFFIISIIILIGYFFIFRTNNGKLYLNNGATASKSMESVELKDGDTYDLKAGYVKKNINGKNYKMLAYNGSIPGPLLKIRQGAEITINFTNDTDMKTLLHSHGVRMDNPFDGTPITQEEIMPGETFTYKLKFPDAGMFWYHPHSREDFQQELGLYGNYLVMASSSDYWSPVNREIPLFLDDILVENGTIGVNKEETDRALMGRFGNVMLTNGETDYLLDVKKGEVIRFYVINSASARPFNLKINGARMKLVGADGGAYEKDQWVDSVILGPSERAVVEALFEKSGAFALENETPGKSYRLGTVNVSPVAIDKSYATQFGQLLAHTQVSQSIDPFRRYFDGVLDKRLTLALDMGGGMMGMGGMGGMMGMGSSGEGGIEWNDDNGTINQMMDNVVNWKIIDRDTGRYNMDIDWTFEKGKPVKIRIFNDPRFIFSMQHPLHIHGQRFLVLKRNGIKETNLVWKDTVFIPAGATVDILLDTSNPGEWMAHCHISEHLENGMMMKYKIE